MRIQACTIIGCGTSDSTQTITLEAAPVGLETPSLTSRTPTTLTIQIQPAANPNGLVLYTLYAMGVFDDSNGEEVNRIVHNSADSGQVVVESLLPFYSYTVYLDVNNTVGGIRSEVLLLQTLGIGELLLFVKKSYLIQLALFVITDIQLGIPNKLNFTICLP